jgi:hypothetical protein
MGKKGIRDSFPPEAPYPRIPVFFNKFIQILNPLGRGWPQYPLITYVSSNYGWLLFIFEFGGNTYYFGLGQEKPSGRSH